MRFSFTPTQSGAYTFYSTGNLDTLCSLRDQDDYWLDRDDDSGEGSNFSLTYNLTAGIKYYYDVWFYRDYTQGTTTVHLIKYAPPAFVAVTNITSVPDTAVAGRDLNLSGTVSPSNATNKTIIWSVKSAGTTGAAISGNTLKTTAAGKAVITATVRNGRTATTDYTKDFTVTVNSLPNITAPKALTLKTGYTKISTGAFTVTGSPAPAVRKISGNDKIIWNNSTKKLDIATGLAAGAYKVTLRASNSAGDKDLIYTLTVEKAAAKPKANKKAGTYTDKVTVKLTSDSGSTIYYTLNGKDPTTKSKSIKSGKTVTVSKTATLKAMAAASGVKNSYVISVKYTIKTKAPDTKAVPASKTVKKNSTINLTAPKGVTLYYTTDGNTPTTSTKTKVAPGKTVKLKITKNTTVKAIARKEGCLASSVVTRKYKVK